ncbi:FASCICLIN-like arabinogalactan-protein 10 [Actinidia rufa]|uniref:FASCICLIN-like arabinogalactan-protein 10 n=1 Tax=Actinidia rufa TaxID=165716 RepID=A0A7J0EWG8_9ERIC|nr:FASCICLIN-like arabinogalactan-protein 10 [Actinidia rufa]
MHLLLLTLSLLSLSTNAHNITEILSPFPEYSLCNSYLSQTKLDGEINSRETVTVLVLNNAAMSSLAAKHPLSVIKNALSLHILLDYYDGAKLHQISDGTTTSTTLYQTTGNAPGNIGSVNITDLKGGKVGFGSAVPGSALDSFYAKEVKKMPYSISVIEISNPIIAPGILTAPASSANITAMLEKAGCKTFAALLRSTGVEKVFETAADKALTYHALPSYSPFGSLKTTKDPISTLATSGAGKFDLTVSTSGDEVTLKTGVGSSRVASTVTDSPPLCVFTVDSLLLPAELFGKAPSPAPGPAPATSPAPAVSTPTPTPATAPSPVFSPPAPPMESPEGSPSEGPSQSEDSKSDKAAAAVNTPALFKALLTVSASVVVSVFLS